jgi:FkbM family methyltransferase
MKVDPNTIYHHKTGVWLRKETHDKYVVGQISQYKTLAIIPGCKVLDIGGHIGLFARYAIDRGAKRVLSIEPDPGNCDMFELNTEKYQGCELIEAAVVSRKCTESTMTFYESNTDTSAHSLVPTRGRKKIEVATIALDSALFEIKPSVVKIDIEGYEYELMEDILELFPKFGVKSFAMELHLNPKGFRAMAREFIQEIEKTYHPTRIPNITEKSWNATGVWTINGS